MALGNAIRFLLLLLPALQVEAAEQAPCAAQLGDEAGCAAGAASAEKADSGDEDVSMIQTFKPKKDLLHMHDKWISRQRTSIEKDWDTIHGLKKTPLLPNDGEADALGLIVLTYGYPTQPGDIDDKRSFCTVDENYQCTDGFSLIKAEVHGLEFAVAQNAIWNPTLKESFTNAVRALLKHPKVRAITANCGFMTNYQAHVEDIMATLHKEEGLDPKPLLMGTLSLGPLVTNQSGVESGETKGWGILKEDERAVVVTANSMTLTQNFYDLMEQQGFAEPTLKGFLGKSVKPEMVEKIKNYLHKKFGIELDDGSNQVDAIKSAMITVAQMKGQQGAVNFLHNRGKYFRTYGAQSVEGFGEPVAQGFSHNASLASPYMNDWVLDTLFSIAFHRKGRGTVNGAFVIFECTELPAYSNGVRMATRLPVWDITTLGGCLMAAAPTYDPDVHVTENADFKACMESWMNPFRLEHRFGKQADKTIVGYSNGTSPARDVKDFDWGLFGKPQGARCTPEIGCFP